MPPLLYKYCSPARIDILETLQLHFSAPSKFNDTFDSRHLLPNSASKEVKLNRVKLRTRLGVLCLAERSDNHLMWVNYAKAHTGFVIGFDAEDAFFQEDGRCLDKVKYRNTPVVLPDADISACFYKSPDWKYEDEWRCVREFQPSESRLAMFAPSMVKEIVLGHLMETAHIAQIMKWVTGYEMFDTSFFLSSPEHKSWKLATKRKTVTLCETCGGDGYQMKDPV